MQTVTDYIQLHTLTAAITQLESYRRMQHRLEMALNALLATYRQDRNVEEFMDESKTALMGAYRKAFQIGSGTKLTPEEVKFINKFARRQFKYLSGFATDVKNDAGTMPPAKRLKLYANSMDQMYWHGWLAGQTEENDRVKWVLGPNENNCEDCIDLASNGPYMRDTLDTVPGGGDTQCLMNCKCSLVTV